jgi:hypothetical protein
MKVDMRKMYLMNDIREIKETCVDAETIVELSVERYEELLNYEFMYKDLLI